MPKPIRADNRSTRAELLRVAAAMADIDPGLAEKLLDAADSAQELTEQLERMSDLLVGKPRR